LKKLGKKRKSGAMKEKDNPPKRALTVNRDKLGTGRGRWRIKNE